MTESYNILHLHSEYSLLDGAIRIEDLIPRLQELGIKSCAITDHGWMAGIVPFYQACKKAKIKPIIGIEAYITNDPDNLEGEKHKDNYHLILLAKNHTGYQSLLDLNSHAAMNNFYYKPRIYKQHLTKLAGNVIVTSACLGGVLAGKANFEVDTYGRATKCLNSEEMEREAEFYLDVFGSDFYLEIQDSEDLDRRQVIYNNFLLDLGKKMNVPLVITSDAHYLRKEDFKLHEILMALQFKKTLEEYRESKEMRYGPYYYVKSPEEMLASAKKIGSEEAYYNTIKVAEQCNVEIELDKIYLPKFKLEEADDYQEFLQTLTVTK